MNVVDLDHAVRPAFVMYADGSSAAYSGYYSCLSSLGAVEAASDFPASIACTGSTTGTASLSFTLDSGASSCFFHDCTDLTPLRTPVSIALVDSTAGPVVAHSTTTLPCPAAPSGFLTGSHHTGSGQVRSGQVAAVSCDYRSLTHPSVLWHHRLGHLSFSCLSRMRDAPHFSSFPPTTAPLQTLHLDVWGPSPVLGPRQERYFLIVVDDFSRYTTVLPLRWKADVPTVLEPWLLARGGAQGLCGLRLHSDHGGELSSTRLETFGQGQGIILSYTLPDSPRHNGVAERRIGLVMEVDWTSMCHAGAPQFLWPKAVRYAVHQLNLWPSDAQPRVTPVSLWTAGSSTTRSPTCSLLLRSVCYYRSRPHRGFETFSPPLFLTPDPSPVAPVAPPLSRPAPSGVSHVTPQSSPPQHPVPVVSGGAGGVVAEGEGTGAAGAGGVGSGGARGVGVEVTPMEDTAASSRWPRPTSPSGFPSVPHFPPCSSLQPVATEPGVVPARGTGGPGGVSGGVASSGGVGTRGTGTVAPTPRTVLAAAAAAGESRGVTAAAAAAAAAAGAVAVAAGESRRGVTTALGEGRAGVPPAAAGAVTDTAGKSRGVLIAAGEGSGGAPVAAASAAVAAAGEGRGGATGVAAGAALARLVHGPLPSPPIPPVQSLSSSQWTRRSPLSRVVSPKPRRSRYRADDLFHLVLRSRVPSPLVFPQPPESSLTVLHDPLSDYLHTSRPVVSRVLSALVTHPTAPLSSVSALVTTVAGFASSHCLDYAAHLVSGLAHSPSFGGAPVFPLEVLEDRQFELGFLVAAVPHLCAMLLAREGDRDALDIPIPHNHAEAVSGPWAS
ncbi:unnamed protein product [Closterium sp. NIES-53]